MGTFCVGIFASPELGVFSGFGFGGANQTIGAQIAVQSIAIVAVIVYTAAVTFGLIRLTGLATGGIRVSGEEESQGLDIVLHEESGYKL